MSGTPTSPQAIHAENQDLSGSSFSNVRLQGVRFLNVNLRGAEFDDVALTGATIRNACLGDVSIADANYTGMTIEGIPVLELLRAYREIQGESVSV